MRKIINGWLIEHERPVHERWKNESVQSSKAMHRSVAMLRRMGRKNGHPELEHARIRGSRNSLLYQ